MTAVVALHVDGGPGVGLGHVSRGLGLAAALGERDCQPIFLIAEGSEVGGYLGRLDRRVVACPPTATGLLAACGEVGAVALVIDSYRVGDADLIRLGASGLLLVCFDDTAERAIVAHLIVNGSPAALSMAYAVREGCRYLLGPTYQIVRPEFVPDVARDHAGLAANVLVTVGGDDVLGILRDLVAFFGSFWSAPSPGSHVDVVVGPFVRRLDHWDVPAGVRLHHAPPDMRALMIDADVAVSAGGQTLYELARCGTPTVGLCVADDQAPNLETLARMGAIEYVGRARTPGWIDRLAAALETLRHDASRRARMARTASHLINGQGAARVADEIGARLADERLNASLEWRRE